MPDQPTIGFLGVGNMGLPMATKLMDAGTQLTVYDLKEAALKPFLDRQARRADNPKHMADTCETVFVSLPTLQALRDVCFGTESADNGVIHGSAIKLLVNTCTVGQPMVEEMAKASAERGITLVDCPISGGPPGARAGTLSVMVSGDSSAIERIRPLLSTWGKVVVAGDKPGLAQVLKLTNNILSFVALAASAEAFVMGGKGGLDPEVMFAAINAGSGRNSATESKLPLSVADRSFKYGAEIDIICKDADLAIAQGERLGVPMWVCQAARLAFKHLQFKGCGRDDLTTIVKHIEDGAGYQLPKTR